MNSHNFALLHAWADTLDINGQPGAAYARLLASAPLTTDPAQWPDQEGEPHPTICRCPDCDAEASPILVTL